MSRLLIRNARLVNEGQVFDADVLIANGRIEKIATAFRALTNRWKSMLTASGYCQG